MRVVLADDSVLLREGIARLLEEAGFDVVGQAGDGRGADAEGALVQPGRRARRHPHAADAHRRGPARRARDPREATPRPACSCSRSTSRPTTRSTCSPRAPRASATCSRTASRTSTEFAAAVRRVGEGGSALDPEVVAQLVGRRRKDDPLADLTPRERGGARADGRGPLEPGDRRAPLHHPARGREARDEHLRASSGCRPTPATTAACSPCSRTCGSRTRSASRAPDPSHGLSQRRDRNETVVSRPFDGECVRVSKPPSQDTGQDTLSDTAAAS